MALRDGPGGHPGPRALPDLDISSSSQLLIGNRHRRTRNTRLDRHGAGGRQHSIGPEDPIQNLIPQGLIDLSGAQCRLIAHVDLSSELARGNIVQLAVQRQPVLR